MDLLTGFREVGLMSAECCGVLVSLSEGDDAGDVETMVLPCAVPDTGGVVEVRWWDWD